MHRSATVVDARQNQGIRHFRLPLRYLDLNFIDHSCLQVCKALDGTCPETH